jgi:hypothetical protein
MTMRGKRWRRYESLSISERYTVRPYQASVTVTVPLRKLANALEVTTDYLLGRTDDPGLAEAGDPLYRDVGKLTGNDRDLARDFLKMLAERSDEKQKK